jgi:hypothetical protein
LVKALHVLAEKVIAIFMSSSHPRSVLEEVLAERDLKVAENEAGDPTLVVTRVLEKHARQFDNLSRRESGHSPSSFPPLPPHCDEQTAALDAAQSAGAT